MRRLARRLKKANYEIWLDEHELVAGDPLSAKIAEALRLARVVLVVVSESSDLGTPEGLFWQPGISSP